MTIIKMIFWLYITFPALVQTVPVNDVPYFSETSNKLLLSEELYKKGKKSYRDGFSKGYRDLTYSYQSKNE